MSPRKIKKSKRNQLEFVKSNDKSDKNEALIKALRAAGVSIDAKEINSFVDMAREFNKRQQNIRKQLASAIYSSSSSSEMSDNKSRDSGKEAKRKLRKSSNENKNRSKSR